MIKDAVKVFAILLGVEFLLVVVRYACDIVEGMKVFQSLTISFGYVGNSDIFAIGLLTILALIFGVIYVTIKSFVTR